MLPIKLCQGPKFLKSETSSSLKKILNIVHLFDITETYSRQVEREKRKKY